jgi:protein PsiE
VPNAQVVYQKVSNQLIFVTEFLILASTAIALYLEVMFMINNRNVTLNDILLLFIYLEVIAMVAQFVKSSKLPIRMPICISIVALSRFMIIDMKNMDNLRVVAIAVAIFILATAVILIRIVQYKYPEAKGSKPEEKVATENIIP